LLPYFVNKRISLYKEGIVVFVLVGNQAAHFCAAVSLGSFVWQNFAADG
jgi:hypothetical protein